MQLIPKVSIIVPVYNTEKYLARCINSIIAQSFTDFELILVNDGSTDNSLKICEEYATKDSRIVVIHKENGGVSSARNKGLDIANGEWISFVDADDWISISYLSDLITDISTSSTDIIFHGRVNVLPSNKKTIITPNNSIYNTANNYSEFFNEFNLLKFCAPYSKLFRLKIIRDKHICFNTSLKIGEDCDFLLKYLSYCNLIKTSKIANYNYLIHSNSASHKLNSFNDEFDELICLSETYQNFSKSKKVSWSFWLQYEKMITIRIERILFSIYTEDSSKLLRLKQLSKIPTEFIAIFNNTYKPQSKFLHIIKFLFSHRYFKILDFILSYRLKK